MAAARYAEKCARFSEDGTTTQLKQAIAATRRWFGVCPGVRFGLGVELGNFFPALSAVSRALYLCTDRRPTHSEVETYRRYRGYLKTHDIHIETLTPRSMTRIFAQRALCESLIGGGHGGSVEGEQTIWRDVGRIV